MNAPLHKGAIARPRRGRWVLVALAGLLLLGACWLAAGPWLAVRGISQALEQRDAAALATHVDFPRLQANLRAQVQDRLVRAAGADVATHPLGALALAAASGLAGAGVGLAATPEGVAALLQGHVLWQRVRGRDSGAPGGWAVEPAQPLRGARLRYESLSRATLRVEHAPGQASTWVLQRQGLRWRLVDVRLPGDPGSGPG